MHGYAWYTPRVCMVQTNSCVQISRHRCIRELYAMRNRSLTPHYRSYHHGWITFGDIIIQINCMDVRAYRLDVCIHYSNHTFGYLVFQSSVAVGSRHTPLVWICSTAVSYHGEANRAHETTSGRSYAATIAYAGARLGTARPRGALAAPIGGDCTVCARGATHVHGEQPFPHAPVWARDRVRCAVQRRS